MADLEGGSGKPQVLSRVWVARGLALVVGGFAAGFLGWTALADLRPRSARRRATRRRTSAGGASGRDARARTRTSDDSLRRAVGQKIITRMTGVRPSRLLLQRIYRGQVGGVIVFAHNATSPAQMTRSVAALQESASRAGNPRLLIAVDQEGGSVRRLHWAPPDASAADLGADAASAFAQGELHGA